VQALEGPPSDTQRVRPWMLAFGSLPRDGPRKDLQHLHAQGSETSRRPHQPEDNDRIHLQTTDKPEAITEIGRR